MPGHVGFHIDLYQGCTNKLKSVASLVSTATAIGIIIADDDDDPRRSDGLHHLRAQTAPILLHKLYRKGVR